MYIMYNVHNVGWKDVSSSMLTGEQQLLFALMEPTDSGPVINKSLSIKENFLWQLHVRGKTLDPHVSVLASFPALLTSVSDIERLLQYIDQCRICCGNPDDKFAPYYLWI